LNSPTVDIYKAFAKSKNIVPEVVKLEKGDTVGCWLGEKNADTILIWFHGTRGPFYLCTFLLIASGGGYASMANNAHFILLWKVLQNATEKGKNLGIFVPQYGKHKIGFG
jgi:hypothetical protein